MKNRFILKRHFHPVIVPEDRVVYLLSEKKKFALKGRLYVALAPLLNGDLTGEEIVERLRPEFDEGLVRKTLAHMERRGYITEDDGGLPETAAAFWELQGLDSRTARERLSNTRVSIENFSSLDAEPFAGMLEELGIRVEEGADRAVVLADDYLQEELREFNRSALETGRSWLLIKPSGAVLWFGPVFVPGETGCWECLEYRLKGNREVETSLRRITNAPGPFPVSKAVLPATVQAAFSLASTRVAGWIVDEDTSDLRGKIITLDLADLTTAKHILTRRPQCPACGTVKDAGNSLPTPLNLKSRKITFTEDGGHRIRSPAETLARYNHLVSPVTGVVSKLETVFSGGGGLVTISMGAHRISERSANLDEVRLSMRNNATGKGRSRTQSLASAFSEAIERYSALYAGDEITIRGTLNQLGEKAVDPEDFLLFSDAQYEDRTAWNRRYGGHQYIPEQLDPDLEIEWSPAWSLTHKRYKYFPTGMCYLMYPQPPGKMRFVPESNGLASGNVLEEAIIHGFMEIAERDAVAIWWYNRLKMPEVDLDSFRDPYFDALREYYRSIGRELWVLDVTNDFGLPSFVALSKRTAPDEEKIIFGFGTHFDARIGISRALTEMNQFIYRLSDPHFSGQPAPGSRDYFIKKIHDTARVKDQPYLLPDENAAEKTAADYTKTWSDDLLEDIETCLGITKKLDLEFLVHDMTRPDIGMSAVRVIVPGARQIRARFAPGRLYTVPVKLGRLKSPLKESDLNPEFIWI